MTKLLDIHCPIKKFKVKAKETYPWVNSVLISVKIKDIIYIVYGESIAVMLIDLPKIS